MNKEFNGEPCRGTQKNIDALSPSWSAPILYLDFFTVKFFRRKLHLFYMAGNMQKRKALLFLLILSFLLSPLTLFSANPPTIPNVKAQLSESGLPCTVASVGVPINWTAFWMDFDSKAEWKMNDTEVEFEIERIYPDNTTQKVKLKYKAKKVTANYSISFFINQTLQDWEGHPEEFWYRLDYQGYFLVFNWTDISPVADIPPVANLTFNSGIQDKKFYFEIIHTNVAPEVEVELDPSTVSTTTEGYSATMEGWNRKTFYANSRFWVFYIDNDVVYYRSSTDGTSWFSATSFGAVSTGRRFSVHFDGTYVHTARVSTLLYYRRGTPNSDGTITWTDDQTIMMGDIELCHIAVDSSGYAYIGYQRYIAPKYLPYISKNSWNNGSWSTDYTRQLNTTGSSSWVVAPVTLTNTKMGVIYFSNVGTIKCQIYNGTGWEDEETATLAAMGYHGSVTSEGDDIYLVYDRSPTTYDLKFVKRTWGSGWGTEVVIYDKTAAGKCPSISIDNSTGDIYVFWEMYPTVNHVYYKVYNYSTSTWGSVNDWVTEVDAYEGGLSSFLQSYGGYIGAVWINGTSTDGYQVRFAYLTVGEPANNPPTIGDFTVSSSIVYANKYEDVNATANDPDGRNDIKNVTIELNGTVRFTYDNATDTFSETSDPNNYYTLDTSNCIKVNVNDTAIKLTFKSKTYWNYTEGNIFVNGTVYDGAGASGTADPTSLFTFEDDLIIHTDATVDKSIVDPSQTITFTASIYYEGTAIAPENVTGITAYVELNGIEKGSDTDVTGGLSITLTAESVIAQYSYNIYATTDQNTVQNQTVNVTVHFVTKAYRAYNDQLQSEGKPYIKNSTFLVTSLSYTPTALTFEVYVPAGYVSETTVASIGRIPLNVYINGLPSYPKSTSKEYNDTDGNFWYYDSTNDLIYVKTMGSTVQAVWEGYTPPPPVDHYPPPPPPPPQLYDVKINDAPFMVIYPFQRSFTVKVTIVNPTSLRADALLQWQLLDQYNQTVIQGTQVIMVPAYGNATTTINIPTPITLSQTYTVATQTTAPLQSAQATQTIQVTSIPTWLIITFIILVAVVIYIKRRR